MHLKLVISTTNPFLHGIKYVFKDSNKNGKPNEQFDNTKFVLSRETGAKMYSLFCNS
jgi:hypothetical protein